MPQLDRDAAEAIAKKLRATIDKSAPGHSQAEVLVDGVLVAHFGIRRGSRRGQGHDYIPSQIHVSMREAKDLANCPMSYEQWIKRLSEKGWI